MSSRKFNGSGIAKQRLRQQETRDLSPDAWVFEGFAGEGELYRTCWLRQRGYCLDKRDDIVTRAAMERPRWACYQGDTERALRHGFAGHVPFEVFGPRLLRIPVVLPPCLDRVG